MGGTASHVKNQDQRPGGNANCDQSGNCTYVGGGPVPRKTRGAGSDVLYSSAEIGAGSDGRTLTVLDSYKSKIRADRLSTIDLQCPANHTAQKSVVGGRTVLSCKLNADPQCGAGKVKNTITYYMQGGNALTGEAKPPHYMICPKNACRSAAAVRRADADKIGAEQAYNVPGSTCYDMPGIPYLGHFDGKWHVTSPDASRTSLSKLGVL